MAKHQSPKAAAGVKWWRNPQIHLFFPSCNHGLKAFNYNLLLLDEPLAALDPRFREELRQHLKILHQNTRTTFFMVTHDFAEAISLAVRAAVMNHGYLEQVGTIREIFQQPASPFVADFVGMKNLYAARFSGSVAIIEGISLELGHPNTLPSGYVAIRPEDIVLSREPLVSSIQNSLKGTVKAVQPLGFHYEIEILVKQVSFKSLITKQALFDFQLHEGSETVVSFKAMAVSSAARLSCLKKFLI